MSDKSPISPMRRLLEKLSPGAPRFAVWAMAICLLFLLVTGTQLERLDYNFDEGVYIYQALEILDGGSPNKDFFSHQTPLYPYALAVAGAFSSDSPFAYRFLSALGSAMAGLLLFAFGRRFLDPLPALAALLLFLFAPLQFYGLIAFPMGLMNLCAMLGALFVMLGRRPMHPAVGVFFLVTGVMFKPLAVSMVAPLAVVLVVFKEDRWKIVPCIIAGVASGGLYWLAFDLLGGGLFSSVLKLQLWRFSGQGGFDLMRLLPPFEQRIQELGIETAIHWNLYEHFRAFIVDVTNGSRASFLYLLTTIAGVVAVALAPKISPRFRLFVLLWWAAPFCFSIVIWEPVWDHYFVQYLPGMALTIGVLFQHLLSPGLRSWRIITASLAAVLLVANMVLGVRYWRTRSVDYSQFPQPVQAGEKWLTFDPFMNFVTGTEPACGLIDPFNVYGEASLAGALPELPVYRFKLTGEDLQRCLDEDPSIRIYYGMWASFFVDPELTRYLAGLPESRFLPGSYVPR